MKKIHRGIWKKYPQNQLERFEAGEGKAYLDIAHWETFCGDTFTNVIEYNFNDNNDRDDRPDECGSIKNLIVLIPTCIYIKL